MMTRPPRQNTEAELQAFSAVCDRLAGFDEQLSPEWIDGYMTALAAGPLMPLLQEWLPRMAGDTFERVFADPEDRAQAESALSSRMVVLLDQLDPEVLFDDPEALRLAPLMIEWDEAARHELLQEAQFDPEEVAALCTGAEWSDGFLLGTAHHADAWGMPEDETEIEYVVDLTLQVRVLALPDGSAELAEHVAELYSAEGADRQRLIDEACWAVQDLRLWWVEHAPKPETRRVEKTPGRNDPCPCGSGKKYKKCHGALAP
jgi:uncharacterized protein